MGATDDKQGGGWSSVAVFVLVAAVALVALGSLAAASWRFFTVDGTPTIPLKLLMAHSVVSCGLLMGAATLLIRQQARPGDRPTSLTPALIFVALGVALGATYHEPAPHLAQGAPGSGGATHGEPARQVTARQATRAAPESAPRPDPVTHAAIE